MPPVAPGLECVLLVDGKRGAVLQFQDEPRRESKSFLMHRGISTPSTEVILLSGDRPAEVALFAAGMGIAEAYGGKSTGGKGRVRSRDNRCMRGRFTSATGLMMLRP